MAPGGGGGGPVFAQFFFGDGVQIGFGLFVAEGGAVEGVGGGEGDVVVGEAGDEVGPLAVFGIAFFEGFEPGGGGGGVFAGPAWEGGFEEAVFAAALEGFGVGDGGGAVGGAPGVEEEAPLVAAGAVGCEGFE